MSQAFQQIGSGLANWGMPNFGATVSNIPYDVSNIGSSITSGLSSMFGGGAPSPTPTETGPYSAGGPSSSGDSNILATGSGTGASGLPGVSVGASGGAFTPPEAVMAPGTAALTGGGATGGAPYSPVNAPVAGATDPSQSMASKVIEFLFGKSADPNDPSSQGTKAALPGLLTGAGTLVSDLMKYRQQQNLLNNLGSQATALNRKMTPAMIRHITAPVIAMGQETGQINAPYLMNQAVATAAAPYVYQQQLEDLRAALEANRIAAGMYPDGNDISALGGFVPQGIFGGGAD